MRSKTKKKSTLPDIIIDTRKASGAEKKKIHGIVQDTNSTAHRILDVAEETHTIGSKTNDELHAQGEQIDSIHQQVAETNYVVKKNKRKVKGINSIWHAIKNFFTPSCLKEQPPEIEDGNDKNARGKRKKDKTREDALSTEQGGSVTILYDHETQKLENDTNRTMDRVEDVVGELEDLALEMNGELDRQNGKLKDIKEKTDDTNKDLDETNKIAKKYLNQ